MTAKRTEASTGQLVDVPAEEATKAVDPNAPPSMHIKVYSPFKTYFDEDGVSISAINMTGPFDILPHHHNFLTLLSPCELIIRRTTDDEQRIRISGGWMHVKADKVIVFLDI
jgi:F0F1-type ATP synthase epsilon subunit